MDDDTKPRLDWFRLANRPSQFMVGVPLHIIGVGPGYERSLNQARQALARPHSAVDRDLLAAECNEFAEVMLTIAHEDGDALSLSAVLQAMLLETARLVETGGESRG